METGTDASSSAAVRLGRRGTPWGCLVVAQFTSTGVPQWKSESLFGAGMQMKFRKQLVNPLLLLLQ